MALLWRMRCAGLHGTHTRGLLILAIPKTLGVLHTVSKVSPTDMFCSAKSSGSVLCGCNGMACADRVTCKPGTLPACCAT